MTAGAAGRPAVASLWTMFVVQTGSELRIRWRIPAFSLTSLLLPLIFFTFFGLPVAHLRGPQGVSVGAFLVASFGAYAVGSVMVFAFGIGVAVERGMKVDLLMRVTPLPGSVLLLSKIVTALVFAFISLSLLIVYGVLVGGVREPLAIWGSLIARLLIGSLPFVGLGFAIGYATGPNSAPGVANVIYLPLSFASGLFMPPSQLPKIVQTIAPYLPTYHYGQIAWGALGAGTETLTTSLAWLAGYAVVFFALALRGYRAEERRKFA